MSGPKPQATAERGLSLRHYTTVLDLVQGYLPFGKLDEARQLIRCLPRDTDLGPRASGALASLFMSDVVQKDADLARLIMSKASPAARARALVLLSVSTESRSSKAFSLLASSARDRDFDAIVAFAHAAAGGARQAAQAAAGQAPTIVDAEIFDAIAGRVDWLSGWISPRLRRRYLARFGAHRLPQMAAAEMAGKQQAVLTEAPVPAVSHRRRS